jgi:hypothetical protein
MGVQACPYTFIITHPISRWDQRVGIIEIDGMKCDINVRITIRIMIILVHRTDLNPVYIIFMKTFNVTPRPPQDSTNNPTVH